MGDVLTKEEIGGTMRAMATVILGLDPISLDMANGIEITVGDTTFVGFEASKNFLFTTLTTHTAEWAKWFEDPSHIKSAISMRVAIGPELREKLNTIPATAPLLSTIDRLAFESGVHTSWRETSGRVPAVPVIPEKTIDLREPVKTDVA